MQKSNQILALLAATIVALIVQGPESPVFAADTAFQVLANERQLFLDDVGIAKIENLTPTMHQPDKKGAVIRPDWNKNETALYTASAPNWDPDANVFKLLVADIGGSSTSYTIWESKDGLHWARRGKPTIDFYTMVYDGTEPDPARRYKGFLPNTGFAVSPDALTWTMLDVPPVPSGDEWNFSFDQKTHQFIVTVKVGGPYGRSHALSTSKDFVNWTKPELNFHADEIDQELVRIYIERRRNNPTLQQARFHTPAKYHVDVYNFAVFRYEGLYIGLPMMFYQTGPHPKYPNQDGYEEIQLACSRDLHNWKRLGDRAAFIAASPLGAGAYDLGQISSPSNAVVRGDELWFYYSGFKGTHEDMDYVGEYPNGKMVRDPSRDPDRSAICLAVLRRDGFISLDAREQFGTIQTESFKVSGDKLFVNIHAPQGDLRVEILNEAGKIAAQSKPLTGDLLREPVNWAKGDIADFKGQTASLRFTLRNGQFYSYWLE